MKEITITERDYAEAVSKAMSNLKDAIQEANLSKADAAELMFEFISFQSAIFHELFDEKKEKKYA